MESPFPPPDPESRAGYRPAPRLFISYRRGDCSEVVETLDGRLRSDLGSINIFRDAKDLTAGEPFEHRIYDEIRHADAVLIVIGPRWEGPSTDPTSPPRLANTDDFVRREVRAALEEPRRPTIPVLVDRPSFPSELPADIDAITASQWAVINSDEITRSDSPGYQQILVGTWLAKSRSISNNVIIFGDGSARVMARLDALVAEMRRRQLIDVTEISRYASGVQILKLRKARNLVRAFPNVVVFVDEESARSPVLAARLRRLAQEDVDRVVILAVGGGITYTAGVATGTGAVHGLSSELGQALVALGQPKSIPELAKLWSWKTAVPATAKLTAGVLTASALTVGAVALWPEPETRHELAGTWTLDNWELVADSISPPQSDANPSTQQWMITAQPADCVGATCALRIEAQYSTDPTPQLLTLVPTGQGWEGTVDEVWNCRQGESVVVEIASQGQATYTVTARAGSNDTLDVTYDYRGTATEDGISKCPDGPITAGQFTGTATRPNP